MNLNQHDPRRFHSFSAFTLGASLLAVLIGGWPRMASAGQVPNPTITANATIYSSTYPATNLFAAGEGEFATKGQGACTVPLTTSVTNGTWVQLDFGSNVTFDRFILATRQDTSDVVGTNVLYVGPNAVHTTNDPYIFTFSAAGSDSSGPIHYLGPVTGRYARWEVLSAPGTTKNLGGRHMWFLDTPANSIILPDPVVITNTSAPVFTLPPYSTSFNATDLTDGNCGNGVSATVNYEYAEKESVNGLPVIVFDFGSTNWSISGFDYLNREDDLITAYNLIYSDDPTFTVNIATNSWTSVNNNGNLWSSGSFPPIAARYVELQATAAQLSTGSSSTPNPGGREIIFYGPSNQGPYIVQQPVANTNLPGGPLSVLNLSVTAGVNGLANTFQWQFNGTNLANGPSISGSGAGVSGSATAVLTLTNLGVPDSGSYTVILSNALGVVTSAVSVVTVFSSPTIMAQPASTNVLLYSGETTTILVGAIGSLPISYSWYSNNTLVDVTTNGTFSTTSALGSSANYYSVLSNSFGTATSVVVSVTVIPLPTSSYPLTVANDHPIGFWPLNETPDNGSGNDGTTAYDYMGGNNGAYTNVVLGVAGYAVGLAAQYAYSPATDTNSSAEFGYYPSLPSTDNYVSQIANINFGAATASSFSVEAWVNGNGNTETAGAGIVSKGYGGGEQFDLDYDGAWRFFFRNTSAATTIALSTNKVDSNWHHLVGVVDSIHSNVVLYVDGVARATTAFTSGGGILNSTRPMVIGSRTSSSTSDYNLTFSGSIGNVAIYNYALSAAQVANHYYSAGIGITITEQPPASTNLDEGTTLVVPTAISAATPPVSIQWYDVTAGAPISGQTNLTLILTNISGAAYNGHSVEMIASNSFGQAISSQLQISVQAGPPNTVAVAPPSMTVYAGVPVVYTVTEQGTIPFSFQWSTNGVNVAGATNSIYTNIAPSAGAYTIGCAVTNSVGPASPAVATASLTVVAAPADYYGTTILGDNPIAFWRLDEPANSSTANDYVGGHNATYNSAVNGWPGFRPITFPSETSTVFGTNGVTSASVALENNNTGNDVPFIDFATGPNAEFSVEAWVQAPPGQNTSGAGIVSRGYGNGGEQFVLDTGGGGVGEYRFFVRNAAGTAFDVNSAVLPDGNWHYLAGTCDEAHSVCKVYVDGVLKASTTITAGSGLNDKAAAYPLNVVGIGSRTLNVNDNFSDQLINTPMNNVALYAYPLSSNQIAAHFAAALEPLTVVLPASPLAMVAGVSGPLTPLVTGGLSPYSYQWQENGTNIPGATASSLAFSNAGPGSVGAYDVIVSDAPYLGAVTSSVVEVTIVPDLTFNTNGGGWALNEGGHGAPSFTGTNLLGLTADIGSEYASSFYSFPVYIGGFEASWTYQDPTVDGANGTCFVIQNDPRGALALGSTAAGNQLGYGGITNSAAIEFNIYANDGAGCSFGIDGAIGPFQPTGTVDLGSGDPIGVNVLYEGGVLTMTLSDSLQFTSFTTNAIINLPAVVGSDTAYVGFTAADGAVASTQTISNFTFISLVDLAIQSSNSTALISWRAGIGGYVLQENSQLSTTNWVNVTNAVNLVGGQNQVAVPITTKVQFYRLSLQ